MKFDHDVSKVWTNHSLAFSSPTLEPINLWLRKEHGAEIGVVLNKMKKNLNFQKSESNNQKPHTLILAPSCSKLSHLLCLSFVIKADRSHY